MKMRILILTAAALSAVAMPAAAQRHTPAERYQMFQDYLVRRAAEVTKNNLAGVTDLAGWKRQRPQVLQRFLSLLGLDPMPARTPLNARITGGFERDGYRVENIVFQSMPRLYVTGNLYLPKGLRERAPAVVYVSGHAPGPWGAKVQYQHHGVWLARHGYAAFVLDTVEFGEVPGIHHGTHDLGMWYWHSLGYTPAGPEVWNAIRALDYLETRPEVDAKRAAVTGISGGGAVTWFTAAADERFQVGASVCGTWTVGRHVALDAVKENCDCIYFINPFQDDLPTVGALIAPRPFKILSARRDASFPADGYHEAYRLTKRFYDMYGVPGNLVEFDYEAPHQDILPFRKEAYEWLNFWLKKDTTPFDEGVISREEPQTLTVLNQPVANPLNGGIHRTFIKTHELKAWTSLSAWESRRPELIRELKDKVFRGFPDTKTPFDAWKSKDGGWPSRYTDSFNVEFTTEHGIRVSGQLFIPRDGKPSHPALIYVKGADDVIYPVDFDPVLPAFTSHVVLILQPRAVDYPGVDNYKMSNIRMSAALIGSTIESMQLWDLLRSVDYLVEGEGLKLDGISVYGRRQMGALGIYAAALDARLTRVILDDPPASHWQGLPLLFVLRITDLPETAGLVAPREIVSIGPLPAAYSYTSAIYRLYGKKDRIREAGSLGQALEAWRRP
jgi:cephalosporin-C deacetylase-like acetyl esterase